MARIDIEKILSVLVSMMMFSLAVSSHLVVVVPGRERLQHPRFKRGASEEGLTQRLSVTTSIEDRYARTLYQNIVKNNQEKEEEVLFQMVLPEDAFISRFAIETGGKVYPAIIQGKEDAERTYKEAVSKGKTAGHVSVSARNSNEFSVSVNVGRGERLTFHLLYEELVRRRVGMYNHTITAVTSDSLKDIHVKYVIAQAEKKMSHLAFEAGEKKVLFLGADGDLELGNFDQDQKVEKVVSGGVTLSAEVSMNEIVLDYVDSIEEGETKNSRQFTVSYDTSHDENLGIDSVIEGSYFAQFIAPEKLPGLNKFVVFVMDISGSMSGDRIEQAKKAQIKMLRSLLENDVFTIVLFDDEAYVWKKQSFSETTVAENAAVSFKNGNFLGSHGIHKYGDLETAIQFTESIHTKGGTNLNTALIKSLDVTSKLTFEYQPIIMFLTDGQATSGETNSEQILKNVASSNAQLKSPAAIFSLGFGAGADFGLLEKLSLQNYGAARKIYDGSDATDQINQIFTEFGLPVLSELTFEFTGNEVGSLTQSGAHAFYSGTELVVAGKIVGQDQLNSLQYHVKGTGRDQVFTARGEFKQNRRTLGNKLMSPFNETEEENLIERLWVYKMIHAALDAKKRCGESRLGDCDQVEEIVEQAKQLAIQHSFVTPLTSLVVVKPDQEPQIESEKQSHPEYDDESGSGSKRSKSFNVPNSLPEYDYDSGSNVYGCCGNNYHSYSASTSLTVLWSLVVLCLTCSFKMNAA